jgi:hypothetical protein
MPGAPQAAHPARQALGKSMRKGRGMHEVKAL